MSKAVLFVSGLFPAILIVGIKFWDVNPCISIGVIAIAALLSQSWRLVQWMSRNSTVSGIDVAEYENDSTQIPTYIITFIFPFIFLNFENQPMSEKMSYLVFGAIIFVLMLRSPYAYINPSLLLSGYSTYKVKDCNGNFYIVIAKPKQISKSIIHARIISDNIYKVV